MIKKILIALLTLTLMGHYVLFDINEVSAEPQDALTSEESNTFTVGQLTYEILSEESVGVKDCDESATNIEIPSHVSYNGINYNVTSILDYAFSECSSLTNITIPNGVTSIQGSTFYGCENLTSVTIADSVKRIEDYAFAYCKNLSDITIPKSVEIIGPRAFYKCYVITFKVENNSYALRYANYHEIPYDIISDKLTFVEGQLTYALLSDTTVEVDTCNKKAIEVKIPEYVLHNGVKYKVESIGRIAFIRCSDLKSVVIPNSVKRIEDWAFYGCVNLTSATIPNSVVSIGNVAFSATDLTNVVIPSSVKSIGEHAYESCKCLTNITIQNGATSIQGYTFYACDNLKSVTLPNSVTSIGDYAFAHCTNLTNFKISDSLQSIGAFAFVCCENLTSITIPSGVKSIKEGTFRDCENLKSITILDSVNYIVKGSFYGCTKLIMNVKPNSYALQYAIENKIPYKLLIDINYPDVKANDWFYYVVKEATIRGLMGVENKEKGLFSPHKNLSRGMVATVLYRMVGSPSVTYSTKFPDVKANIWYSNAIIWANNTGVVKGYDNGKFGPDDNITREQLAIMLFNYASKVGKISTNERANVDKYKDVKGITSYAKPAIQWAVAKGIISGKENGTKIAPIDNATRAESAKMFVMLQDLVKK